MSTHAIDPVLARQLKRLKLDGELGPQTPAEWAGFLAAVNDHYLRLNDDRSLVNRSLELSTSEMDRLRQRVEMQRDRLSHVIGAISGVKYRPRTSDDRDATVSELTALAERAGALSRVASRIGEVAHELLMNAMYDAPVNHYGEARYAHDRRASIVLDAHEVPTARMATDGNLIAVQVADPFGRLTRAHVMDGILRGQRAREASDDDAVIDDSHGGAGLGLWKIFTGAAVTLVDLTPAHTTSVTAVFDIDVGPREARTMPPSLHVFERSSLDVG